MRCIEDPNVGLDNLSQQVYYCAMLEWQMSRALHSPSVVPKLLWTLVIFQLDTKQ